MKSRIARSLTAIAVALTCLVTATPRLHADAITTRGKVLARIDDAWSNDAHAKNVDRVASYYAEDAVAYPPNEPAAIGREAAKKVWAAYFAAPSFTISWTTTAADIAKSGDLGFTAGTYEDSWDAADGTTVHEKGKYVCVWRRQKDGSWKAIHDTWNADSK